jgi:pilus assembly protein CpaB
VAWPRPLDALAERWWAARPRTRLALGLVVVLLVIAAGTGHVAATPYGPPTVVLVAARDLAPGAPLTDADLMRRTMPADLVPAGALLRPDGVLAAALPAGAVATDRHLGDGGWAAGLPEGRVAVAVPAERLPQLTPGTRARLVGADHDGRATVLGEDAVVLGAEELGSVWFAVNAGDAVAITGAAAVGALAVVVLPP